MHIFGISEQFAKCEIALYFLRIPFSKNHQNIHHSAILCGKTKPILHQPLSLCNEEVCFGFVFFFIDKNENMFV
jgi:hypothetical protein